MGNTRRLILAGVVTLLVGLIITFPARVAYQWFGPGGLKLSGIAGSIWRGSAKQGSASGIYLTDIRWSFRPLALLRGRLGYAISSNPASGFLDANVAIGVGGVNMSDVNGAISLAALGDALPLKGIEGDVSLRFDKLVIRDGWTVGAIGTVDIANLVSRYLSPSVLGDYRAEFQSADEGILASVEAVSGVLELAGTITLTADRSYALIGQVAAKPSAPPAIRQQLQYLGSPDARGMRDFRVEGQL
jgi:general secretion pathway protein N